MLSLTLAIALAVPRGVSVLRVVLRAVPGGARLLRDIRPRRPCQQHPHFAGEKIISNYRVGRPKWRYVLLRIWERVPCSCRGL